MNSAIPAAKRKIRMGMVGGGRGAFIGAVHRIAANIDGQIELVCGAFSSDPQRSRDSGADLFLPPGRCYGTFEEMMKGEAALPVGERMDFVSIVTPNHVHFPAAKSALEHGFPVMSDKPVTFDLAEARELGDLISRTGLLYGLTHNYTGYPLIKQARELVLSGRLGTIRKVVVEYPQGWLSTRLEESGQKQAAWRTDPARSGAAGCIGDIGTHAYNLADFITQIPVVQLSAELTSFVPGRRLDDNCQIMLRYANGARGMLWVSQVAPGHENGLKIRVYGTKGSIEWVQANPNYLIWSQLGQPQMILTRGGPQTGAAAARVTRVPGGHPEGYLEGFANIYTEVAHAIRAARTGAAPDPAVLFPSLDDGLKGMAFIEAAVASSRKNARWVAL